MNVNCDETDGSGHDLMHRHRQRPSLATNNINSRHHALSPVSSPSAPASLDADIRQNGKLQWLPKALDLREAAPAAASTSSPLSVVEIFVEAEKNSSGRKPTSKYLSNRKRGVDSPIKTVDIENAFFSSSDAYESMQDLLESLPLEDPALKRSKSNTVFPPLPLTTSSTSNGTQSTPCHRRQDTGGSTSSAVAAVARGYQAAVEANQPPEIVLDKPVLCPQRQQTEGAYDATDDVTSPLNPKTPLTTSTTTPTKNKSNKTFSRRIVRPRPPRHDSRKQARVSMIRMQKVLYQRNPEMSDERVEDDLPRSRQSTEELQVKKTPVQDIVVTPKSHLHRALNAEDTRDDDIFGLNHHQAPIPVYAVGTTSDPVIKAWLNMTARPKKTFLESEPILRVVSEDVADQKDGSEPTLRVPRDLFVPTKSSRKLSSKLNEAFISIASDTDESEDSACHNPPPQDEEASFILSKVEDNNYAIKHGETLESSVPSFYSEVQAKMDSDDDHSWAIPLQEGKDEIVGNASFHQVIRRSCASPTFHCMGDTGTAAEDKEDSDDSRQRRAFLPPTMPDRHKPSLHVRQDVYEDMAMLDSLWASMPVVSQTRSTNNCMQSSWPAIRTRLSSEDTTSSRSTLPPCLPTRHRRQDSLLSEEAECETMQPASSSSPKKSRRSTMPPLQPHRRKPSLLLDNSIHVDSTNEEEEANLHASSKSSFQLESLWASMPILSGCDDSHSNRSSLLAPPSMPHRRKPSLNIMEDGEEGMIEIWLSHHGDGGGGAARHHRRQSSHGSVATTSESSILLREGEAEI